MKKIFLFGLIALVLFSITLLAQCPEDMVQVNDYCIDKDLNHIGTWEEHVRLCGDESKRLCSYSEWTYLCLLNLTEVNNIGTQSEGFDNFLSNQIKEGYPCSGGYFAIGWGRPTTPLPARCCKSIVSEDVESRISALEAWQTTITTLVNAIETQLESVKQWLFYWTYQQDNLCKAIDTECEICYSNTDCGTDTYTTDNYCLIMDGNI